MKINFPSIIMGKELVERLLEPKPLVQRGTYAPGETPAYSFCESVAAGPLAKWHIRKVNPEVGLRLGGGIDTGGICGWPKVERGGGWDVNVKITKQHLRGSTCPKCREAFEALNIAVPESAFQ